MDDSGANARDGGGRKRTQDGKLVNGDVAAYRANGATTSPGLDKFADLPPELAHLPTEYFDPLAKLYQRTSQECFNDLNQVLQAMAQIPIQQHPNGVLTNGAGGHANGYPDNSEANKEKKLLLMRFAQENRAKFIKLLVLTEWGRKSAAPILKVIDLNVWAREQDVAMDMTDTQLDYMKLLVYSLGNKNPDIRTALEVLSKGKAEWIPDMGFIPPEPVSAEKALKLLRYMNTSLSIRLNVHEHLPRHLKKWRVANGRATFVVDGKFEMDLISFSEDTSEQWHFIDLRLLFSPAPEIDVGSRFQMHLKPQLDFILSQSGLSGCFDWLHNFVMTHKIAVLRLQAHQLQSGTWSGTLKVEKPHRALVVQYWMDRPGKKNWIEIGVCSNRPKNGKISWRGPPIPSLTVRWFCNGVEVKDEKFDFDFNNLSMERMLKTVICRHIARFFKRTQDELPPAMTAKETISATEPCDCALEVSLGRPENKVILAVEPASGRPIVRPRDTIFSTRAETHINGEESSKTGPWPVSTAITEALALSLLDSIHQLSKQIGWYTPERVLRTDTAKKATQMDVLQFVLYRPRGWTSGWSLAVVIDTSGETWWLVELDGSNIKYTERLIVEKTRTSPPISRATLASIERILLQQLAICVTRRELEKRGIASRVCNELADRPSSTPPKASRGFALCLHTSDLLPSKAGEQPWLGAEIRVISQGFQYDNRYISHIASGTVVESAAADMQKLMYASPNSRVTFSANGTFAILLTTKFGEPVVDELKERLRDVARLRTFATILEKRHMRLKSSSLQQVQFQYGINDVATVNFERSDDIQIDFPASSPHNRIRKFLHELINDKTPFNFPNAPKVGLDRFCQTLIYTRPLLATLASLEATDPANLQNPAVYAHRIDDYRITYANPLCSFDIRLRKHHDNPTWYIEDNDKKPYENKPSVERTPGHTRIEALKTAISTLFKEGRGRGWHGIRSGIVADLDGISDALRALHKSVIACAMEGGYHPPPPPAPITKVDPAVSTNAANSNTVPPQQQPPKPAPPNNARPAMQNQQNQNARRGGNGFPNTGGRGNAFKQEVIELD